MKYERCRRQVLTYLLYSTAKIPLLIYRAKSLKMRPRAVDHRGHGYWKKVSTGS
jgi:hypothetical protein